MPDVRVTIDDQEVSVPAGSTVLDAADEAGIDIPTLCAHPALEPIGACRMCLVEIEKQRTLQPACTFPVSDRMVIHTRSEEVVKARRFVLQLLFSERNHFCMFCQMSGSCELQDLAYDYGLDHWEFDRAFPALPVDASREYFVMDHNRCILCRRCVRICDEMVGNATLGLKNRGANTMIVADLDVPFGESSCIACGSCLQVCPTGALMDRASAYMGADDEIERVKSRCMACSIGCGVELIVRDNRVIRVEGDWDADPNQGLLCELGRFSLLYEDRKRVRQPLVRREGVWEEVDWDVALRAAAEGLSKAGNELVSVASGFASNEVGAALVTQLPGQKMLMNAALPEAEGSSLSDLDEADLFILVDVDLTEDYQVAGMAVRRGVRHRDAKLLILDDNENGLDEYAFARAASDDVAKAVEAIADAEQAAIIYDAAGAEQATAIAEQAGDISLLSFAPDGNARGLAEAGIDAAFDGQQAAGYLVIAGETTKVPQKLLAALADAEFTVVHSSFREPWDGVADVILPMPTAYEQDGSMVSAQGEAGKIVTAVKTKVPPTLETVQQLSALL